MNIEEFLQRGLYINKRIESQKVLLQSLEEMAVSSSSTMSGMLGSGSPNPYKLENNVVKITELKETIKQENEKLMEVKKEIHELLSLIEKDECRIVLQQRYECCRSMDEVAAFTGYVKRHVRRLKLEGIRILHELVKEMK